MNSATKPYLSPQWIHHDARRIVEKLQRAGYTTYLVGGCVRDLLLGIAPKDFDIATTALPQEVRKVIPRCYIIGKRFRLVLANRGTQQFEIATFRRNIKPEDLEDSEENFGDNYFGTPEEDAKRRDFTINGMFYDPVEDKLIDYADAQIDLDSHIIKMIGEPNERLEEDSIRILRAIRLSHKIKFSLEPELRCAMQAKAETLADSALPRRREEYLKFLRLKEPHLPWLECFDLGVLKVVSPTLQKVLESEDTHETFLQLLRRFNDYPLDKSSPVELFAGLVHAYVRTCVEPDPTKSLRAKALLEDEALVHFMKFELGMFNHEQELVAKALQMESVISSREEFEQKDLRKQLPVIKSEALPLSFQLSRKDHLLTAQDNLYWNELIAKREELIDKAGPQTAQRKRRRRRR